MGKKSVLISLFFSLIFSFSCSLTYTNGENSEDKIPEFIFKNAQYTKYQNGKKNLQLKAEQLEQYKSDNAVFAKNADFTSYNSEGSKETSGSCQLIAANTKKEIYNLFGDISLSMASQEMEISANVLRFNKKTEQISSGNNSTVTLNKKDIQMTGKGFSASGVSKSYSFLGGVSGKITTSVSEDGNEN
ncbi:LPS export ABC transporter periplasmic protein LptC [Treponema sp. UBA3813]|uniref:LPS export ABC transporter periplasmic protein LptC n=1 Tax=Treponema sp. UBA3813 TaxID=1947715 RepID=UPI0025D340CE|nr:LPS export ABC transporter periplasmic protein LptC [Treponema sp. UBA3813]